jgi:putative nucleotidyltransferase with HDIG domain
MLSGTQLYQSFPGVSAIGQADLRKLVTDVWEWLGTQNPVHRDLEAIPLHPSLPISVHGNLATHKRAMTSMATALVATYAEQWRIDLDLDEFLTAVYLHDAAKVIEFVERDGQLVATPGFNHAIEGARIARRFGAPPTVAHMIAAHSFAGPLVRPRSRAAQLFMFLDAICLPAFPEHGDSAVDRHLRANSWTAPPVPADTP